MSKIDTRFMNEIPQSERAEIIRESASLNDMNAVVDPAKSGRWNQPLPKPPNTFAEWNATVRPDYWANADQGIEPPIDGRDCANNCFDPLGAYTPNPDPASLPATSTGGDVGAESERECTSPLANLPDEPAVGGSSSLSPVSSGPALSVASLPPIERGAPSIDERLTQLVKSGIRRI
jgi:hypothetical protein